ncbi:MULTISPECIES: hypothetical protein [Flavobacterium]|uniref:hypothetical protein n=1 Tax=Flavobacterium TaxID=237 RepID=UPI001FCB30E2|nr:MULTISPECIES: hypothetical protein [Flavobacterium]UOK43402.1 hypothetical protein LZF87_04595 [Flavobacterium enshiense]
MEDFEAIIVGKHNLNIANVEALAKDIAHRLNINIEYGFHDNGFRETGKIINHPNEVVYRLTDQKNINQQCNYVLELGDEAKIIYQEIISLQLPRTEDYRTLIKLHKNYDNGLAHFEYFAIYFEELKKLGAAKIYVIDTSNTSATDIDFGDEIKYTWEEYTNLVKANCNYFLEPKHLISL